MHLSTHTSLCRLGDALGVAGTHPPNTRRYLCPLTPPVALTGPAQESTQHSPQRATQLAAAAETPHQNGSPSRLQRHLSLDMLNGMVHTSRRGVAAPATPAAACSCCPCWSAGWYKFVWIPYQEPVEYPPTSKHQWLCPSTHKCSCYSHRTSETSTQHKPHRVT
jgi:hypothetical protein